VIYTPPKTFKRGRFLLQLASVVAVVCAIVLGMSIFFKVRKPPEVSGCIKYTPNEVYEASGIEMGTNLMTQGKLADVAGVSRATINTALLKGSCSTQTAGKIAKALGVDPADIIEKED
jgi:DNA-binding XRE family transcriptional regulator